MYLLQKDTKFQSQNISIFNIISQLTLKKNQLALQTTPRQLKLPLQPIERYFSREEPDLCECRVSSSNSKIKSGIETFVYSGILFQKQNTFGQCSASTIFNLFLCGGLLTVIVLPFSRKSIMITFSQSQITETGNFLCHRESE